MRAFSRCVPLLFLLALIAVPAARLGAQGLPTSQPQLLTIYIEELKPGTSADHEKNEVGWPAAFAKAKSQTYYLAVESVTGTPEVWYLVPYASYAAEGADMKSNASNSELSAAMSQLAKADAQFLERTRAVQAMARPDLSYGPFPDLAQVRFYDITMIRIRLGHEAGWVEAAKKYMELAKRNAPGMSYRIYQVTAGMPSGTYLIFSSMPDYAGFDTMMANDQALWGKATPEELAAMSKYVNEDFQLIVTNHYRVSPTMSYVSPEVKAKAPDFWK